MKTQNKKKGLYQNDIEREKKTEKRAFCKHYTLGRGLKMTLLGVLICGFRGIKSRKMELRMGASGVFWTDWEVTGNPKYLMVIC